MALLSRRIPPLPVGSCTNTDQAGAMHTIHAHDFFCMGGAPTPGFSIAQHVFFCVLFVCWQSVLKARYGLQGICNFSVCCKLSKTISKCTRVINSSV